MPQVIVSDPVVPSNTAANAALRAFATGVRQNFDELYQRTSGFPRFADVPGVGTGNDDTDAINAWISEALLDLSTTTNGVAINLGPGRFNVSRPIVLPSNKRLAIIGDGKGISEIKWANTAYLFHRPAQDFALGRLPGLRFRNFTAIGGWYDNHSEKTDVFPAEIWSSEYLEFYDMEVLGSRCMGLVGRDCDRFIVQRCHVRHCARDAISASGCLDVDISFNVIEDCDDDGIAYHTQQNLPRSGQETFTCIGNHIRRTGGIKALGLRHGTIAHNVIDFPKAIGIAAAIEIGDTSTAAAQTSVHHVDISNNVISNVINTQPYDSLPRGQADYIYCVGLVSETVGTTPGTRDTSGGVVSMVPLMEVINGAGQAIGPSWNVQVKDNIVGRTRQTGVKFSDYSFDTGSTANDGTAGMLFGRSGWYDPMMTNDILQSELHRGVVLGTSVDVSATGNKISKVYIGVLAFGSPTTALVRNIRLDNEISDVEFCGYAFANITDGSTIVIDGGIIDGDPEHTHTNRTGGGKWKAATVPTPAALLRNGCKGITWANTHVKNVLTITEDAADGGKIDAHIRDVHLHCKPHALGYDAQNIGIGIPARAGGRFRYHIVDGDPTSSTFNKTLNECIEEINAAPDAVFVSGERYVEGHELRLNAQFVSAGKLLKGWFRMTTGTAHVIPTDWQPEYVSAQASFPGESSGLKMGRVSTGANPFTVATGLSVVFAVTASLETIDAFVSSVTATIGDQAGSPPAGSIIIETWKPDGTPAASLGHIVNYTVFGG